jgi:uncharacterized membrane protein YraQ (UPF0718 family)
MAAHVSPGRPRARRTPSPHALSVATIVLAVATLLVLARSHEFAAATLSTFSTRFLGIFIEAAPFLAIGSVASGLIEIFLDRNALARIIPRNPYLAGAAGVGLGFVVPVCECGVVPVTRRLYSKGLPLSVGATFLLASPVINPIVLASTWTAFGPGPVLVGRYAITAIVALAVGWLFALAARPREVLQPHSLAPISGGSVEAVAPDGAATGQHGRGAPPGGTPSLVARLRDALGLATDEFFDMGRYLIVGSLLAAAMQTLVAQEALIALGSGPVVSVLVMQALAYLLSVCSTVDAFIALAFTGTFTTGAILAFLTFGPMVDFKSTLLFLSVFRPRTVAYLVLLPLLMTLAIGIWVNLNVA